MTYQKKSGFFDKMTERMKQTFNPNAFSEAGADVSSNFHALSHHLVHKMNLVTREDHDNLQAVLRHTRERMEALENKVTALEKLLKK